MYSVKDGIQIANRYMKECSGLLVIRKTQIKTPVGYHLTPVRMGINEKNQIITFSLENIENRLSKYTTAGNVN